MKTTIDEFIYYLSLHNHVEIEKEKKGIPYRTYQWRYAYNLVNSPNMKISTHAKHMIRILKAGGTLG